MHYFAENAVCCSVSAKLHPFVIATERPRVIVAPLENGRSVLSFAVEGEAVAGIWITPAGGYILALVSRPGQRQNQALSLFTINGLPLRSVPLTNEPTAVAVWASLSDFDYVAVGWKTGLVVVNRAFEFTLQKPALTFRGETRVVALAFDIEARAIVAVFADGIVLSEQCDLD
jgi:hypothetical protein